MGRCRTEPGTSVYQPLGDFLRNYPEDTVTLTFAEIEAVIGCPLPPSAYRSRNWWHDEQERPHQRAWLDVGWEARSVRLRRQTISFERVSEDDETMDSG